MNNSDESIDFNIGKKKKIKCFCCKKKSLIMIRCKCGNLFCLNHKCPESHNCTFNFKHEISKDNIIDCNFKKIDKI